MSTTEPMTLPTDTHPPVIPTPREVDGAARLVVSRGAQTGTGIALHTAVITIGRHADNHIVLGDPTVSARHAQIRADGDRHLIVDVGSLNGTYVNRKTVDQTELHDGDEIWIGRHRLVFQHRKAAR
jgi:pSer/pThr/pTyr-binding forkhead associated (FHA) protein